MGSLTTRQRTPERMDAPDLDPRAHAQALAGLRRLNRAAGAGGPIAGAILEHARLRGLRQLSILDVACGGGDVSTDVALRLKRVGIAVDLTLTDMSAVALEQAAGRTASAGIQARTERGAAPEGLPAGPFDVVMCTLFLHHLSREEAVATLRAMAQRATGVVVVSDLRRSWLGYALAWVMCRLMSRSPIVHFDGPVSVQAAWTLEEMRAMAADAGVAAEVRPCFPERILMSGKGRGT